MVSFCCSIISICKDMSAENYRLILLGKFRAASWLLELVEDDVVIVLHNWALSLVILEILSCNMMCNLDILVSLCSQNHNSWCLLDACSMLYSNDIGFLLVERSNKCNMISSLHTDHLTSQLSHLLLYHGKTTGEMHLYRQKKQWMPKEHFLVIVVADEARDQNQKQHKRIR